MTDMYPQLNMYNVQYAFAQTLGKQPRVLNRIEIFSRVRDSIACPVHFLRGKFISVEET